MSLRRQSLRGGGYLAAREGAGIAIRLVGVLALTRLIGPEVFGVYSAAVALVTVFVVVARWGTEVYLVRRAEDDISDALYDQVFTYLLLSSTAVVALGLAGAGVASAVGFTPPHLLPFVVLLLSVPVNVLWVPSQARIERAFRYRQMAWLELSGDLALYGTSVTVALLGGGIWAPVSGYVVWQLTLLVGSTVLAGRRPRVSLSRPVLRDVSRHGVDMTAYSAGNSGFTFANLFLVTRFLGAEAAGYVALAARLVDTLGFVLRGSRRLAVVALSRVQSDRRRMRRALEEGMSLQTLTVGTALAGFALVAGPAITLLWGESWSETALYFPFVALNALLVGMTGMQVSVLRVLAVNGPVTTASAVNLVALTVTGVLALPTLGLAGFALMRLAGAAGGLVLHRATRRTLGVSYVASLPWVLLFLPVLAAPLLPWPWALLTAVPLLLAPAVPVLRRQLTGHARMIRSALRPGPAGA